MTESNDSDAVEQSGLLKRKLCGILGLPPVLFARRLLSDSTLGLAGDEQRHLEQLRLSAESSLYGDRFRELRRFWPRNLAWYVSFFAANGWPFSRRLQRTLGESFEGRTEPPLLKEAYDRTTFHYAAVLMLSMHRGQWLVPFVHDIESILGGIAGRRVLDYGCGVADMGLLLAKLGADVTLVDLDNERMEFVKQRFQWRSLPCRVVALSGTEQIPPLQDRSYDLIVATEVLEHVRSPLALLKTLTDALAAGGVLFCSIGIDFDRRAEGDHLVEAIAEGHSPEYSSFFASHYELIVRQGREPWLFRKKPTGRL